VNSLDIRCKWRASRGASARIHLQLSPSLRIRTTIIGLFLREGYSKKIDCNICCLLYWINSCGYNKSIFWKGLFLHEPKIRTQMSIVCYTLEEMLPFRTRNGSIPCFIYGTPKWFYIEPRGTLFECIEHFRGSKYVALIEPFKVLYRTFSSLYIHLGYIFHLFWSMPVLNILPLQVAYSFI